MISIRKFLFSLIFLFAGTQILFSQSAFEILQKVRENAFGTTNQAVVKMTIVRPDWTRTISIKSWSKGDEMSLILVTDPARDKGTVFLKRSKEIWNWLPSVERTVKLPPSMMTQSWMGSDFSNDDLVHETSLENDFTSVIEKEETIDGTLAWKIVLTPKEESNTLWGKIITWVSKKDYNQLKSEFYDEDEELVNTLKASDIRNFGGRMIPAHVEMIPAGKTGQKTMIDYSSIIYNQPISDDFFSLQNIKNVR